MPKLTSSSSRVAQPAQLCLDALAPLALRGKGMTMQADLVQMLLPGMPPRPGRRRRARAVFQPQYETIAQRMSSVQTPSTGSQASQPPPTRRLWGSLYYFAYFAANGALFPYYTLFYKSIGIDEQAIGVLVALPTLVTLFASPLWSGLADALRLHRRLLPLSLLATMVAVALLMQSQSFAALAVFILLQAFLGAPIISLADNAVMELLGEHKHLYGKLRLWGAVGYGSTALLSGAFIDRFGFQASLLIYIVLMLATVWVSTRLPAPALAAPPLLRDLRQMLTNSRWMIFLGSLFLVGACSAILNSFFVLYMQSLGASAALFGLAIVVASLSELPVFFLAPRIIKRGNASALLMIAFGAYALRALLCSLVRDPWMGVAVHLLHGLTFSALWTASVTYAREIAPPGWSATAQAAMGSVLFGLAVGAGALLGGTLYASAGPVFTFQVAAVLALAGLAVFAVQTRRQVALSRAS
jgi:PPP family 3-phenylpropionic acid transporter